MDMAKATRRRFFALAAAPAAAALPAIVAPVVEMHENDVTPMMTIEEMMDQLALRVKTALSLSFKDFTGSAKDPSTSLGARKIEIIVSFLALLELVKQGAVDAEQSATHGDIQISHTSASSVPHYG